MQLLYGPNTGQSNNGCYESKAFDAFYEKSRVLPPDSPERNRLFLDMTRQMEVDGAWSLHVSRERNQMHPAVGEGLQEASDPAGGVRLHGRRQRPQADAAHARPRSPPMRRLRVAAIGAPALHRVRGRRMRADPIEGASATCFPAAETGFDPAGVQDLYSATIEQMIFETLLTYDYLARPSKLVPLTAEAMPRGHRRRQDVHVQDQEGHLLHADPAFKGKQARARRRRTTPTR